MIRHTFVASCVLALALNAGAALAGEKARPGGPSQEAAEAAKKQLLEHLGARAKGGQIDPIGGLMLRRTFPDYQFFALHFRQYPVAMVVPEGLKFSNVFAVSKDGKVEHLKDAKDLEAFFRDHGPQAGKELVAVHLTQGWLQLSTWFVQDGFYKFTIGKPDVKTVSGMIASAGCTAMVTAGGNGEIRATLRFDNTGKVEKADTVFKIHPGPRPICQATKLLDPDPVVRRMAEQDLLYLGLAARDYLREQRAAAGPELRRAIDRLWERIQKEGW
jgi:hypothetical protein